MTRPPAGRRRFVTGLAAGVILAIALTALAGHGAERATLPWKEVQLFTEVLEKIRQEYLEPVGDAALLENAIRGMVASLDAHSRFLDAEEYEEVRVSTTGNYSGIGIEVNLRDGRIMVVAPIEGTPAEQAGIRTGDIIIGIDDIVIGADNLHAAVARLRGPPDTRVKLVIERPGEARTLLFDLARSNVQVRSVRSLLLEPGYAWIRISQFSDTTGRDLRRTISRLQGDGGKALKGIVLDLRNNPGGVLEAAVEVSDQFLQEGVIVSARGRGHEASFRHEARAGDAAEHTPIVVLINGGSASAAEIVAAALRDHQRATLLGSQSFGKGSVQTIMPLAAGGALKLTTSRYYRPSGEPINDQGIMPDVLLQDEPEAGTDGAATEEQLREPAGDPAIRQALGILQRAARASASDGKAQAPRFSVHVEGASTRQSSPGRRL